jgi:hypothetical protein
LLICVVERLMRFLFLCSMLASGATVPVDPRNPRPKESL